MKSIREWRSVVVVFAAIALAGGMSSAPRQAAAVVVDFDDLVLGDIIVDQPGNVYAAEGVNFSSGDVPSSFDAAISVGDVFTLGGVVDGFAAVGNENAISNPNFAAALDLGLQDTLMSFSNPVTSLSLHSDDAIGDGNDLIRLLALEATGNPDEYRVLSIAEGSDGAVSEPDNLLTVGGVGGFSYGLFQVTTELEGFDDVTYEFVPEPSMWLLLVSGALIFVVRN